MCWEEAMRRGMQTSEPGRFAFECQNCRHAMRKKKKKPRDTVMIYFALTVDMSWDEMSCWSCQGFRARLGAVNWGCGGFFVGFFLLFSKKKRSEIATHGNLGCRTSDFPRACCNERLFCRETLKSPRRRRQVAALGKASK